MLILAPACSPDQQTLSVFSSSFFSFSLLLPRRVGSGSRWRTEEEEEEKGGKERSGEEGEGGVGGEEREKRKKQPRGWRKILYACALKREVCGQLLKDFTRESRLSTESIEEGREERRASYDYASATQPYWANRDTVGSVFFFFVTNTEPFFFPPQSSRVQLHLPPRASNRVTRAERRSQALHRL